MKWEKNKQEPPVNRLIHLAGRVQAISYTSQLPGMNVIFSMTGTTTLPGFYSRAEKCQRANKRALNVSALRLLVSCEKPGLKCFYTVARSTMCPQHSLVCVCEYVLNVKFSQQNTTRNTDHALFFFCRTRFACIVYFVRRASFIQPISLNGMTVRFPRKPII